MAFGQLQGQPSQGLGGLGGLGATGAATGTGGLTGGAPGAIGGATANAKYGFGAPGSGATGASLVEYSTINAVKGFATSSSAGGQNTLSSASPFGANAFSNTTTTGMQGGLGGGLGGGGLGGLAGGLGGGLGGGRVGGLGGIGGLGGGLGGQSTSAQNKKKIKVVVTPDPELPRLSDADAIANVRAHMQRIKLPAKLSGVSTSVDGNTLVLRGQVATDSEKRLVEKLVKLEPGVDLVRNEVTVQTKSPERIRATPIR